MSNERETYIKFRLDRAHEALEEAPVVWKMAHYNSYASRLYYACFYAVSALLLKHNLSSTTHSGTQTLFAQHFVKTGIIPREMGEFYHLLLHYRQESDYKDNYRVNPVQAEPWLPAVERFVE